MVEKLPPRLFLAWSLPLPLPAAAWACWLCCPCVKFSDGLGSAIDLRCSKHCFFGERNHTFHDWEVLIITNPSCCHSGSLSAALGDGGACVGGCAPLPERLQVCSVLLCVASPVHLWLRPRLPDPCSAAAAAAATAAVVTLLVTAAGKSFQKSCRSCRALKAAACLDSHGWLALLSCVRSDWSCALQL